MCDKCNGIFIQDKIIEHEGMYLCEACLIEKLKNEQKIQEKKSIKNCKLYKFLFRK